MYRGRTKYKILSIYIFLGQFLLGDQDVLNTITRGYVGPYKKMKEEENVKGLSGCTGRK
jgi:hypothetical protein